MLIAVCAAAVHDRTVAHNAVGAYTALSPNEEYQASRHTYGEDSIVGHTALYRLTTERNNVFVDLDITILELNPHITDGLLAFIRSRALDLELASNGGGVDQANTKKLAGMGMSQCDIVHQVLDMECSQYHKELMQRAEHDSTYNLSVKIYPTLLNESRVAYVEYACWHTGDGKANDMSLFQTFDLTTGKPVASTEPTIADTLHSKVAEYAARTHWANEYPNADSGRIFSEQQIDSIRKAQGVADCGTPFPIDVYDEYVYRHGKIMTHYDIAQLYGTWVGYGHLYDPRHIVTFNSDGTYAWVKEEPYCPNGPDDMRYGRASTIKGIYDFDKSHNRLTLLNQKPIEKVYSYDFIKYAHPEHRSFIIHSIDRDTMYLADDCADLWPYIRSNVNP